MRILAIETSTDETGVSIIETTNDEARVHIHVLADALASQAKLHNEFGGVYPTLAKREHAKNLPPLLLQALKEADLFVPTDTPEVPQETIGEIKELLEREPELFVNLTLLFAQTKKPKIDAIAVTHGPGLEPALWVGVTFAQALAKAWELPLMPINHMEGHIVAALFERSENSNDQKTSIKHDDADSLRESASPSATTYTLRTINYPALSLLISGGHTELVLSTSPQNYTRIGKTRDDAVGEAFDKSARLLSLPYPGGPEISKLAQAARDEDLAQPFSLPRPMIHSGDYDFSFSGLKTAVRNLVQGIENPTDEQKKQVAREIEDAIAEVLVAKTKRAIDEHTIRTLIVGGGVIANAHIRGALETLIAEYNDVQLFLPTKDLATDNGRMIAFTAAIIGATGTTEDELRAHGNLTLDGSSRR